MRKVRLVGHGPSTRTRSVRVASSEIVAAHSEGAHEPQRSKFSRRHITVPLHGCSSGYGQNPRPCAGSRPDGTVPTGTRNFIATWAAMAPSRTCCCTLSGSSSTSPIRRDTQLVLRAGLLSGRRRSLRGRSAVHGELPVCRGDEGLGSIQHRSRSIDNSYLTGDNQKYRSCCLI